MLITNAAAFLISHAYATQDGPPTTLVPPPWKHTLGLNRVKQTHLGFYSGYKKKFSNPSGIAAVKLVFNDESGTGDDDELTVYGVNSGTGEIFYNKSMTSIGFFGKPGGGAGEFRDAAGVAADAAGNVVVADKGNNRVVFLRNRDNRVVFVKAIDLSSTGTGLRSPSGVCIENGSVYIADTGNDRIVVTDLLGNFVREFTSNVKAPFAIAVISGSDWNHYGLNFVVVTDSFHQRLTQFNPEGEPLKTWEFGEVSGSDGGFYYVAVDYYSNVYVTDTVGGCIYKFDRYLRYITRFGCGTGTGEDLIEPRGIAIYRRFGQVFVAEKAGASYFWVGTDVRNIDVTWRPQQGYVELMVKYLLTEHSDVTVSLETEGGKVAKIFEKEQFTESGRVTRRFKLYEHELPCPVESCDYVLVVTARPTYSSVNYHTTERRARIRRMHGR